MFDKKKFLLSFVAVLVISLAGCAGSEPGPYSVDYPQLTSEQTETADGLSLQSKLNDSAADKLGETTAKDAEPTEAEVSPLDELKQKITENFSATALRSEYGTGRGQIAPRLDPKSALFVQPDSQKVLNIYPAANVTLDDTFIASFKKYLTDELGFKTSTVTNYVLFENNNFFCSFRDMGSDYSAGIFCAELASYLESATLINQLVPDASKDINTAYSYPKTVESPISGFRYAEIAQAPVYGAGGSTGLYYQQDGSDWQFLKIAKEGVSCKAFNSSTLKNAFAGYSCRLDNGSTTTVAPAS